MLVLRLLVMVLTIICLMDGHAEVSSSTTGMSDGGESPAVKPNEPEVQILDRKKKKKPKKSKKTGKKKKPKKIKPKPTKPVKTTPTMSTSTLKTTTILTTPTITTTATTTTPTTTVTTATTTIPTTATTSSLPTTAATTADSETTTPPTTSPTTPTTSLPATASPPGECKATNGKPCIFPFKDGNEEYNMCKNKGGVYYWCATSVYGSGKYKHWSYCPLDDDSCPFPGGKCKTTKNLPCIFPFKDGEKEYNECPDDGKRFWCATSTNSAGQHNNWGECKMDGSCPIESTTPAVTSTATAASTTPLTTGTTAATDQMEEKVLDTLENLVLGESRDDSLQMAHMLDKKLDTIIKDLEGETSKTELSNSDDMPPASGKLNINIKRGEDDSVRDGTELGEGLMFVLSTVDSMKSVSRLSGDCCQDCTSKYPDTELAEYWDTLDTCYCYKKMKIDGTEVEPKTRPSSEFTTKACDITTEDTCCETLTISSTGGTAEHQGARLGSYKKDGEHNNKPVYKQQEGTKILFFSEYVGFEWVFGSSVNSGGGLRSKPGSSEACPSDVKQWEYYVPGTTNTWEVDSTADVKCDGENNCGIETKLDSTRFIAELNTAYIFNAIDKTQDPNPRYRTQVFDVVTFDKENQPRRVLEEKTKPKEYEADLVTLFLITKKKECNKLTFQDASLEDGGYYPVFISSSLDDLTKPIEKFIADAQSLKPLFNDELPKLCATWLRMENETAKLRENEMKFLFNFFYNSNDRNFEASQEKQCKYIDDTIASIRKLDIFDTSENLYFDKENVTAYESDKVATFIIKRNSSLNRKAVGFIKTSFSTGEDKCSAASADDIVPLSNTVFFNENEREAVVIIRVKQDDVTDDNECVQVELIEENSKRNLDELTQKTFLIGEDNRYFVRMMNERRLSLDLFAMSLLIGTDDQYHGFYKSLLKPIKFVDARDTLIVFEPLVMTVTKTDGKPATDLKPAANGHPAVKPKPATKDTYEAKMSYSELPPQITGQGKPKPIIPKEYYEVPEQNRLQHVIHEIGRLIWVYGRVDNNKPTKDSFIYLKVDNLLYQIALDRQQHVGNLYARAIGCFFTADDDDKLTKENCLILKGIDITIRNRVYSEDLERWIKDAPELFEEWGKNELHKPEKDRKPAPKKPEKGQYDSLAYPQLKRIMETTYFEEDTKDEHFNDKIMVLQAMKRLLGDNYNDGTNYFKAVFRRTNVDTESFLENCKKVLFAAETGFLVIPEIIRFPDILPSTLRLIPYLGNAITSNEPVSLTDVHPMTRHRSWMFRKEHYISEGNLKIDGVGFMPYLRNQETWNNFFGKNKKDDETIGITKFNFYKYIYKYIEEIGPDFEDFADILQPFFKAEEINKMKENLELSEDLKYGGLIRCQTYLAFYPKY